ncbi:hypothetical protein COL0001_11700 [Helicobacter pylori]|uniref:Uncharacterized protein n=2 Tax=Helicobacter pylori TaxID=210 RepID=A0A0E0WD25_HELPX|nr:hypothetical protein HPCU_05430 [Helicobacter pylori Cuz20]ADO05742.1 hypothetical protein HPSAT_05110 [Helicobacter pylori Sat464]AFH99726.1 hypothetical protein HPSH169_05285 [Helicobacter pylori Shi169]AFI01257.1 hypothetical protein HPSH112_05305 [Helicobacter pylori Shi112]
MIKKRFLKEWGMTNLYSKLDNTAFYDWIKNAQKQPFFLPYLFNFMVNF